MTVVLLNNDGGGIFQYLHKRGKIFEYLFSTPHGIQFSGLETLYGIHYHRVLDYGDFKRSVNRALASQGIYVIEVCTEKERVGSFTKGIQHYNDKGN